MSLRSASFNGANLERPNLIANPNSGPQTPAEWFNTAAFGFPLPGMFGTAGRNVITGPAFVDFDAWLQKEEAVLDSLKIQFRVDG